MTVRNLTDSNAYWSDSLAAELLRFLTGRIKCPDIAAELTHDTYLGLRRVVEQQAPENTRAMAFRIAMNLAVDYQRKMMVRDRHTAEEAFDTIAETVACPTSSTERVLIGRERLQALNGALAELPLQCRTVFLLHGVEGLTYSQIAERLGISKSLVNKLLAQAMHHCADRMAE
ncbi:RNA polymerase subunit sigma-24 [Methylomonas sp. LWB]|uniref:sigma-70 family RNA polymerase sigma factor n=1 Tax=Methylomonas sp. LWB TaxID=1905845 RepID=UPI0008DB0DA7|nr:sigma-70 family RNA polymerase sigma factor [Methylomonas sp. LWB]OHX37230.1 RNA polymerase subunit sigma-24 [Methylomonas sp. LWB]